MILGFTGTRYGMTAAQMHALQRLLEELNPEEIRHGQCVGADAQFHELASDVVGFRLVRHMHPCDFAGCRAHDLRAEFVEPPEPALVRNLKIVQAADIVIAAPREAIEQQRGGTWSTWRAAVKLGKPTYLVLPDGTVKFTPAKQEV